MRDVVDAEVVVLGEGEDVGAGVMSGAEVESEVLVEDDSIVLGSIEADSATYSVVVTWIVTRSVSVAPTVTVCMEADSVVTETSDEELDSTDAGTELDASVGATVGVTTNGLETTEALEESGTAIVLLSVPYTGQLVWIQIEGTSNQDKSS